MHNASVTVHGHYMLRVPLLSVSIRLLIRRQLDDENAGLSMLKALLVVGCLRRALGVQHKDLVQGKNTWNLTMNTRTTEYILFGCSCLTCWAMALILQYSASADGEWDGAATFTSQASPLELSALLWKHAKRFCGEKTKWGYHLSDRKRAVTIQSEPKIDKSGLVLI